MATPFHGDAGTYFASAPPPLAAGATCIESADDTVGPAAQGSTGRWTRRRACHPRHRDESRGTRCGYGYFSGFRTAGHAGARSALNRSSARCRRARGLGGNRLRHAAEPGPLTTSSQPQSPLIVSPDPSDGCPTITSGVAWPTRARLWVATTARSAHCVGDVYRPRSPTSRRTQPRHRAVVTYRPDLPAEHVEALAARVRAAPISVAPTHAGLRDLAAGVGLPAQGRQPHRPGHRRVHPGPSGQGFAGARRTLSGGLTDTGTHPFDK